jgi:hypothetical protein
MSHATTSPEAAAAAQTLFRVALGGVLIAHGSQKLFGWFGGGGIEGTSKGMHAMGFRPAKPSAILAGGPRVPGGAGPGGGLVHHRRDRTLLPGCAHRSCPGPALDAGGRLSRDPRSHRGPALPPAQSPGERHGGTGFRHPGGKRLNPPGIPRIRPRKPSGKKTPDPPLLRGSRKATHPLQSRASSSSAARLNPGAPLTRDVKPEIQRRCR